MIDNENKDIINEPEITDESTVNESNVNIGSIPATDSEVSPEESTANEEIIVDDFDDKLSPEKEFVRVARKSTLKKQVAQARSNIKEENVSRTQTKVAVLPKHLTDKYKKKSKNEKKSWFEPAGYTETVSTVHGILKTVVYIIFITMIGCFLAYYLVTRINDLYAFIKPSDEVEISIPENATINEISDILYDAGIIEYPNFFKLYAKLKNANERYEFTAGSYVVNPMMNYDELFLKLEGTVERTIKIMTIPEGFTVDEIIDLFVKEGLGTKEGFENVIQNYDFEYDFVKELDKLDLSKRKYRLEGYLYPDTYEVYTGKNPEYYIYKLLDRFDEIMIQKYKDRAAELGFTVDQIITLASMVEKEAKFPADFEGVACVFHNRLKNPASYPKLESDATVVYAIQTVTGNRLTEVKPEHLTFQSPFNTYTNDGLPTGPIASPGYQAITSALYPGASDNYFFVSNLEGVTYFAQTLRQHQANIKKVEEENAEFLSGQ